MPTSETQSRIGPTQKIYLRVGLTTFFFLAFCEVLMSAMAVQRNFGIACLMSMVCAAAYTACVLTADKSIGLIAGSAIWLLSWVLWFWRPGDMSPAVLWPIAFSIVYCAFFGFIAGGWLISEFEELERERRLYG